LGFKVVFTLSWPALANRFGVSGFSLMTAPL
jgi:hypothetical protein